jgi:hypothetical protein
VVERLDALTVAELVRDLRAERSISATIEAAAARKKGLTPSAARVKHSQ